MRHLLVATDGSMPARKALDHACALARGLGAELTLIRVLEPPGPVADLPAERTTRLVLDAMRVAANRELFEAQRVCSAQGLGAHLQLREGNPAAELLRACDELHPDLLVVGSHGRGAFGRLLLGSVSNKLVHRAHVPLLVVPWRPEDDAHAEPAAAHD